MSMQANRHGQKQRAARRRRSQHQSQGGYCRIVVSGFRLDVKPARDVNFERIEHSDGTVTETGRPEGIAADLPLYGEGGAIERMIEYVNG